MLHEVINLKLRLKTGGESLKKRVRVFGSKWSTSQRVKNPFRKSIHYTFIHIDNVKFEFIFFSFFLFLNPTFWRRWKFSIWGKTILNEYDFNDYRPFAPFLLLPRARRSEKWARGKGNIRSNLLHDMKIRFAFLPPPSHLPFTSP